jgi:hypothetical protein
LPICIRRFINDINKLSLMNRFIFGILFLGIIGAMFVGINSLQNVNADKTIVNKCEIDEETGKCEFDQTFKSKRGDIKVKNEIDASAIADGGGNGGEVIDQTARDEAAKANAGVDSLSANATRDFGIFDQRIGQLANIFNENLSVSDANQSAQINALWNAVNEAITDIEGGNQSTPTEPPSNDTGEVPSNDTGGVIPTPTNDTGGEVPSNDTGEVPTNDTGEVPGPITNDTGTGNETTTEDNSTEFEPEPDVEPTAFSFGSLFGLS